VSLEAVSMEILYEVVLVAPCLFAVIAFAGGVPGEGPNGVLRERVRVMGSTGSTLRRRRWSRLLNWRGGGEWESLEA
jgi:hypothetical protein